LHAECAGLAHATSQVSEEKQRLELPLNTVTMADGDAANARLRIWGPTNDAAALLQM